MAIHPDPTFPVLAKDQADVIRLYIDMMRERDRSGREPEMTIHQPFGRRHGFDRVPHPDELHDVD